MSSNPYQKYPTYLNETTAEVRYEEILGSPNNVFISWEFPTK